MGSLASDLHDTKILSTIDLVFEFSHIVFISLVRVSSDLSVRDFLAYPITVRPSFLNVSIFALYFGS